MSCSMQRGKCVRLRGTWLAALVGFCGISFLASMAWAGKARIAETVGPNYVVVEADEATDDEILQALAARFRFGVERHSQANGAIRFSGRLQGSLLQILERVLRHEGYAIVRSVESESGISRVVILDSKSNASVAAANKFPGSDQVNRAASGVQMPGGGDAPAASPGQDRLAGGASTHTVVARDPTLRQLENIGRQILNTALEEQKAPTAVLPPSVPQGRGPSDMQRLTQQAMENVQSLATSLRAACIGHSCAR